VTTWWIFLGRCLNNEAEQKLKRAGIPYGALDMNEPLALAQHRAMVPHDDLAFCVDLPLYALIERHPRPDAPDYIEISCTKFRDMVGMNAFISPIDAMVSLCEENQRGRHYELCPFELTDPRPFMKKHGDVFHLFIVYGFAGNGNKLLTHKRGGGLIALKKYMNFNFKTHPDYASNHFHLRLHPAFVDWLDQQLRLAGMEDYGSTNKDLTEAPISEIELLATEAMQAGERTRSGEITQCAFYDSVEQCWRFIAYSDPNRLGFAHC
jgi:hypothetical protein